MKDGNFVQRIQDWTTDLSAKMEDMADKNSKEFLTKKHEVRIAFYTLLIDYMRSPGESNPLLFFRWLLGTLDSRAEKEPHPLKVLRKLTRIKNEGALRRILERCDESTQYEPDFNKVIKPYLPDDEFRIISSASKSDITGELEAAVEIAKDKKAASDLKWSAIMSNVPILIISLILHYVLYSEIYEPAVVRGYMDDQGYSDMSFTEKGHYHYYLIINYWYVTLGVIGGIYFYIRWLLGNWHKRGLYLRENYVDYIPPFSITKVSEQYSLVLIVSSSMKAGINFYNALEDAKHNASKYMSYQIDKILSRSHLPAHVAFDTQFMGEFGSMIKDRGDNVKIDVAMSSLLGKIREIKNQKLARAVNVSVKMTIRPLAIISVVAGLAPYLTDTILTLSELTQNL